MGGHRAGFTLQDLKGEQAYPSAVFLGEMIHLVSLCEGGGDKETGNNLHHGLLPANTNFFRTIFVHFKGLVFWWGPFPSLSGKVGSLWLILEYCDFGVIGARSYLFGEWAEWVWGGDGGGVV